MEKIKLYQIYEKQYSDDGLVDHLTEKIFLDPKSAEDYVKIATQVNHREKGWYFFKEKTYQTFENKTDMQIGILTERMNYLQKRIDRDKLIVKHDKYPNNIDDDLNLDCQEVKYLFEQYTKWEKENIFNNNNLSIEEKDKLYDKLVAFEIQHGDDKIKVRVNHKFSLRLFSYLQFSGIDLKLISEAKEEIVYLQQKIENLQQKTEEKGL